MGLKGEGIKESMEQLFTSYRVPNVQARCATFGYSASVEIRRTLAESEKERGKPTCGLSYLIALTPRPDLEGRKERSLFSDSLQTLLDTFSTQLWEVPFPGRAELRSSGGSMTAWFHVTLAGDSYRSTSTQVEGTARRWRRTGGVSRDVRSRVEVLAYACSEDPDASTGDLVQEAREALVTPIRCPDPLPLYVCPKPDEGRGDEEKKQWREDEKEDRARLCTRFHGTKAKGDVGVLGSSDLSCGKGRLGKQRLVALQRQGLFSENVGA